MTRVLCMWTLLALCLCGAIAADAPPAATPTPTATKELIHTPNGKVVLWYRTPATTDDLQLPFVADAEFQQSYAYRVRDRKNRDLMSYACVRMTTNRPTEEVLQQYIEALGGAVQRSTDKDSGEISLVAGEAENFRMVVVEPRGAVCHVRLERVQHFTVPARIYTPQEQRVISLLDAVAAQYRDAAGVGYALDQREEPAAGKPANPVPPVRWSIAYQRPNSLTATALEGKTTALEVITQDEKLVIRHAGAKEEQRAFTTPGRITLDLLPEVQDEPVARMMLGDTLITPAVDYLALLSVKDVPLAQQAEVVLTYPDLDVTLRLRIDMVRKLIVRSEMHYQTEEDDYRIIRSYTDYILTPTVAPPTASIMPGSQPTPATAEPGP